MNEFDPVQAAGYFVIVLAIAFAIGLAVATAEGAVRWLRDRMRSVPEVRGSGYARTGAGEPWHALAPGPHPPGTTHTFKATFGPKPPAWDWDASDDLKDCWPRANKPPTGLIVVHTPVRSFLMHEGDSIFTTTTVTLS